MFYFAPAQSKADKSEYFHLPNTLYQAVFLSKIRGNPLINLQKLVEETSASLTASLTATMRLSPL